MNRTIREAAAVLGQGKRALRDRLKADKVLNRDGTVAAQHIGKGHLFMDLRATWNKTNGRYHHYSVVMITEDGIAWLAKRLGISITVTQHKDHVA
ncbi:phage antirepressor KilAC domain-containing protein [Pseudomonas sp. CAN2814]|uniref:phage antirepressor KilAC domain-containing protein n=1 Tax=Pseudomonas sp. CAN1 TaxID=3046726 RepID=UPI00264871E7|nr:phage antirepressor KilAC domain-containing protein [Pseudomonas sp. CAN1]MDN6857249.1 phage antirepressor KilAC domain-containing protein [Pseudomonas sp. CAN1]